jgi:hypothetical protein
MPGYGAYPLEDGRERPGVPKSGYRFSKKIMRHEEARTGTTGPSSLHSAGVAATASSSISGAAKVAGARLSPNRNTATMV